MAQVRFLEGFDTYPSNLDQAGFGLRTVWQTIAEGGSWPKVVDFAAGRFNDRSIRIQNFMIKRPLQNNDLQGSVGFAYRVTNNLLNGFHLVSGENLAGNQFEVGFNSDGSVYARRNGTQVALSSRQTIIRQNTWHYVEVEYIIHATTGRLTVYVDGAQVLNFVGNTVGQTGSVWVNRIQLGNYGLGTGSPSHYDDMYYAETAERVGECRVQVLRPTADTATKDWTPSTGTTNFDKVNSLDSDANAVYVSTTEVYATDIYEFSDMPVNPLTIFGVQVTAVAKKTEASTKVIVPVLKSGSEVVEGPDTYLSTDFSYTQMFQNLSPTTGQNFTLAEIDAIQAGFKLAQ